MTRPEYVTCIRQTHGDRREKTWCGRRAASAGFCFLDIDHATTNNLTRGRLVPCAQCVQAVVLALDLQQEPEPASFIDPMGL